MTSDYTPKNIPSHDSPTVLIVDDEELVGQLLHDMLRLMGYAPQYCPSPVRALQEIEENNFDIILSDYRMPQMSGKDFYNEVLARNPQAADRMIFLTGDTASDDTQFFLKTTGNMHLNKPFHFNKVKETLDEALEKNAQALLV